MSPKIQEDGFRVCVNVIVAELADKLQRLSIWHSVEKCLREGQVESGDGKF